MSHPYIHLCFHLLLSGGGGTFALSTGAFEDGLCA